LILWNIKAYNPHYPALYCSIVAHPERYSTAFHPGRVRFPTRFIVAARMFNPPQRNRRNTMPGPKIQNMTGNLNIVLSKDQINDIVRKVIGAKGEKLGGVGGIGPVSIASDYCCVDASVGSSVVGPVSTVASSVSIPSPEAGLKAHDLKHTVAPGQVNPQISVPGAIKVR
jgi:hypothetical protein